MEAESQRDMEILFSLLLMEKLPISRRCLIFRRAIRLVIKKKKNTVRSFVFSLLAIAIFYVFIHPFI